METIFLILLLILAGSFLSFFVIPFISHQLKIRKLDKIGRARGGSRSVRDILAEVNWHNDELNKCKSELNELLTMSNDNTNFLNSVSNEEEPQKLVNIVFNSKEIACRYQGVDVPKYMKNEHNKWFEFENIASYDDENRAIVDDVDKTYITIHDVPSNTGFFFKQLENAPILNKEIEDAVAESL